ncbi:hypothetical protein C7T94_11650 [Pedobacter yulinensis]|uniref:HTH cro/C1-type domain-containing protein n=1 Tax=Pedobacter yulinensis TaxID=2126353 RepID=A0A2T3HLC7_9SPHI|nr:hypothetical protein [Pedobacter yulinensis]PST83240.1 hypothetical protein C7T94_11650 [Pedobacter yulinensis]
MVINAGEIVELAVRRQNVNISELSRKMNVNRRTLYNWFQQRRLSAEVVHNIGRMIQHDFSKDFTGEKQIPLIERPQENSPSRQSGDMERSDAIFYWMEKYIRLLEEYKNLLQNSEPHRLIK